MDIPTHIKVLGWLHLALHFFSVLVGITVLIGTLLVGGLFSKAAGTALPFFFFGGLGLFLGLFLLLLGLPGLLLGYGLLVGACWSRIFGLVMSFLLLVHVPLGTLLGIYGFVILSTEEAKAYLCS